VLFGFGILIIGAIFLAIAPILIFISVPTMILGVIIFMMGLSLSKSRIIEKQNQSLPHQQLGSQQKKYCSFCWKEISFDTSVCPHCDKRLKK
jgi:hypothetical protein